MTDKDETEYQRAWRERGEAEAALREWRGNQRNPSFAKGFAIFAGIIGALMVGSSIEETGWHSIPMALMGTMFMSILFFTPSVLRDEARRRENALATLRKLGIEP